MLYDFQADLVRWALRRGRAALFCDCGLGKTPMQLEWADNIVRQTNRPVLVLTPLAVGQQTEKEGVKFGINCERYNGNAPKRKRIVIANYEKLHRLDPSDYSGVVADESSILKNFDGKRRAEVTEFMRTIPYRLLCSATPSPNDYIEMGTSSEALGYMGHMDMLTRFFKHDQGSNHPNRRWSSAQGWRFRGHSEMAFWRWVCSWAMAMRKPSDLGYDDTRFVLPPLRIREHIVETKTLAPEMLFALPATNMQEEREERRRTIQERCEKAAELVRGKSLAVIWCHLNDEGDLLEKIIPDAKQIKGAQRDEVREEIYTSFTDGKLRVIIIKPKIGAWGLNWQHCNHMVSFMSHSYEQYYQSIRRCWRFGQIKPVTVDLVATEGEMHVKANLKRKALSADEMFKRLIAQMTDPIEINSRFASTQETEVPEWL
jgi:hypothetical protein